MPARMLVGAHDVGNHGVARTVKGTRAWATTGGCPYGRCGPGAIGCGLCCRGRPPCLPEWIYGGDRFIAATKVDKAGGYNILDMGEATAGERELLGEIMKDRRVIRGRRSIRLKRYDYSQAGAYFVTICTQNGTCLFGDAVDGVIVPNSAGRMIQMVWEELAEHYYGVETDEFVVMPNHVHGIVIIVGAGPRACPDTGGRTRHGQPLGVAPTRNARNLSLSDAIHRFKTMTTKRYADGVKRCNWQPFDRRLWQRNYYEHIIRNEEELNRVRDYRGGPGLLDSLAA